MFSLICGAKKITGIAVIAQKLRLTAGKNQAKTVTAAWSRNGWKNIYPPKFLSFNL
jgi:hypothetical protein